MKKIKDRMTKPEHWCRLQYMYRSKPRDGETAHCLAGWVMTVYGFGEESVIVMQKLHAELSKMGVRDMVVGWNDHPDRTFQQVRALVVRLDI